MALATRSGSPSGPGTRATRTDRRPSRVRALWDSSLGKKTVMAVSGLVMLAYLVAHMLGNLKIFFGPAEFNGYAHWLRTIGAPLLHHEWALWFIRVVLLLAVVLHAVCAAQLSRRGRRARPQKYVHRKVRTDYATRTMRWGGVILGLFVVWHLLDLTTGTAHPGGFEAGKPYQNVVDTFSTWYGNAVYLLAVGALGLHLRHGFWSAAQTLGQGGARRDRALELLANGLALALTAGFAAVPLGVMTGLVD